MGKSKASLESARVREKVTSQKASVPGTGTMEKLRWHLNQKTQMAMRE